MTDVVVAVPSFRRPEGLERLLTALEELETGACVSVLVADNDADNREASAVCERLSNRGYRWPLDCIVAQERGIFGSLRRYLRWGMYIEAAALLRLRGAPGFPGFRRIDPQLGILEMDFVWQQGKSHATPELLDQHRRRGGTGRISRK